MVLDLSRSIILLTMRSVMGLVFSTAVLVVGSLAGSVIGAGIGLLLDVATGAWVSWALLTVPLGGVAGLLAAAAWGVQVLHRT